MTGTIGARATRPDWSRRAGVLLMLLALVAVAVTNLPAGAQEPTEETIEVELDQIGLFASPLNDTIPDTLVSQFPPQIGCVLFPQLCTEDTEVLRGLVGDLLGAVDGNETTSPLQPVAPDTLTLSYLAGTPRYQSAFRIAPASLPSGDFDRFTVAFPQGQPSFMFDSPLFRGAVTDLVNLAGSQDPQAFLESLTARLEDTPPLDQPLLGIEACPLTLPIPAGAEPPQAAPILDIEEPDGEGGRTPAVDCLFGSNGVFDAESQTWSFDLTFAAQAWADGSLPNRGVLLRPVGAENLAFGDPDVSTNSQVTLDVSATPTGTVVRPAEVAEPESPPPSSPPPSSPPPTDTTTTPPSSTAGPPPPSSTVFTPPPPVSPGTTVPPPSTAAPEVAEPSSPDPVALDAVPVSEPAETPWVWLILLVFAVGAWLTARSLTAELVVGSADAGTGALTRLVQRPPA